jgi:L-ascorbate metabolism protein UlaG (beta-lactamase superfamily)
VQAANLQRCHQSSTINHQPKQPQKGAKPTVIEPLLKDDAFLDDVARVSEAEESFHLWWLGQSGFLIKWHERHLIIDPYLSDSLAEKYKHDAERTHQRLTARVVDPARLSFIDVATSSHNHTDHLDGETLRNIWFASPAMRLVIPEANRAFVAERLGIHPQLPIGLDDGESVGCADFRITGIAAAHNELEQDEQGRHKLLGYVFEFGDHFAIYHSGDTLLYEGLAERLQPFKIDVAILPINGYKPERRVAGNLNGREAAQLAKEIGAAVVIPCHYDMFAFNTESPDEFIAEAERIGQPYRVLRAGERWSSNE